MSDPTDTNEPVQSTGGSAGGRHVRVVLVDLSTSGQPSPADPFLRGEAHHEQEVEQRHGCVRDRCE